MRNDLCGLVYYKGFAESYCSSQLAMLLNIHRSSELAFELPAFKVFHVEALGLCFKVARLYAL